MFASFFKFDILIGSTLIQFFYYLGRLIIFVLGIKNIFESFGDSFGRFLVVILFTLISFVVWRFTCELYLLLFRISDDLRDIKNHHLGREANNVDIDAEL